MRVLILSQYFWPESFRINEVADSLSEKGCEVTVLTGHPCYPPGKHYEGVRRWRFAWDSHPNGHRILRVPLVPRTEKGEAKNLALNYLSFVFFATLAGLWWGRREKWDVVFVYAISPILQSIPGMAIRRAHKSALVTWVQDLWPDSLRATGYVKTGFVLGIVEKIVRWIYRNNDLLLAQSRAFIPSIADLAPTTEIRYHPNPGERAVEAALEQVSDASHMSDLPLDQEKFNIVFAGNLGKLQGLATLLDAAELTQDLPEMRWVFVGDGSEKRWLVREIDQRGLANVDVHNSVSPKTMPGVFERSQVLLVSLIDDPSISRTIPSKVQAYLAAGRPILGCMNGEAATVVREAGAGLVASAGNSAELAENARTLASCSPDESECFAKAGQAYYRDNFASATLAGSLIDSFAFAVQVRHGSDDGTSGSDLAKIRTQVPLNDTERT